MNPYEGKRCEYSKTCDNEVVGRVRLHVGDFDKTGYFCDFHIDQIPLDLKKFYGIELGPGQSWKSAVQMDSIMEPGTQN